MNSPAQNAQLLSVVVVVQDQAGDVPAIARELNGVLDALAVHYEIVFVDNGSRDETLSELRRLTRGAEFSDVQVYALHRAVDKDVAAWAGVENAHGDYVAVVDADEAAIGTIAPMLAGAAGGCTPALDRPPSLCGAGDAGAAVAVAGAGAFVAAAAHRGPQPRIVFPRHAAG